jgi:hypothetical protein
VRFRPILVAIVLIAIGLDIGRSVTTRDDLGPLEYVTTYALLIALGMTAIRFSRQSLRRR